MNINFGYKIPKIEQFSLSVVFAMVFMLIFGSMAVVSKDSGTEITSLPFTADISGETYYLTQDLICDGSAAGITIAADGITINGHDHKITGTATPADCEWFGETEPCAASGIYSTGYDNVVIENIKITGFGTGIALKGTGANKIQNNIVDNCDIYDNGFSTTPGGSEIVTHGIHACWLAQGNSGTPALKIVNCNIYNNKGTGSSCGDGGNGIFIYAGGPESKDEYAIISDNKLYGNAKAGFWTKMMLTWSQVSNNKVYENGDGVTDDVRGGIVLRCRLSSFNTAENNMVYDNDGDGIYVGGSNNEFTENIVRDNTENGINLGRSDGSQNNEFYYNYICGHTGSYYEIYNYYSGGGGNTGDDNAGATAHNYRDQGTVGNTYFTYFCSPDTTITNGPSGTIDYDDITFTWMGDGYITPSSGLKYSYKLEGYDSSWSSWISSTSKSYNDLDNGRYTFKVKARDRAGNMDQTPSQRFFTVDVKEETDNDITPPDVICPDTVILSGPSRVIDYNNVTLTWAGSDDVTPPKNLQYSYKLISVDSSWSSWKSSTSKTYNNLLDGDYTFNVKAKDKTGNIDLTPAERLFTVDMKTGLNTYLVEWQLKQGNIPFGTEFFASKKKPYTDTMMIPKNNLKRIKFKLEWKDNVVSSLFGFGKDILTLIIVDPSGNEIYTKKSWGQGTITFTTPIINSMPSVEYIGAENITEAKEKLKGSCNSRWKDAPIGIKVRVNIGELRILKRLQDTGNEFNLNVTYEYYEGRLVIEDDPIPQDSEVSTPIFLTDDFTFIENMTVPFGHGFVIGTNNITIDGSGFTLDGINPGPCEGGIVEHCGIYNIGYDNVIIKNLEIKNFCSGIYLSYNSGSGDIIYRGIIDNCEIHHNGNNDVEWTESQGIKMIGVSDSIIKNCEIHDNAGAGDGCEDGGNGIFIMGTSSGDGGKHNRITNNEIYNNTKGGFFTKMKPEDTVVDNNTIYGNGQGGIILRCMLSKTHIIENNFITENFGCGIFIGGPDNIIRNNVISNNKNGSAYTGVVGEYGTGVDFGRNDGSYNNSLLENIICRNEAVDVEAYDSNDISGNHGVNNTGMTATNYRDDRTMGTTYFTYPCNPLPSENDDGDMKSVVTYDDTQTPGFETVLSVFALLTIVFYISYKRKRGTK